MSRVRTALSLFAATSLCVGLAACQPSATAGSGSQADSQATSQTETQSQSTTQDTKNTKDSAANSDASSKTTQTTAESKPEAKSETTTKPEATPAPESEPATPSDDNTSVSGYLTGVCANLSNSPAVSGVTLEGNVLTIQGSMSLGDSANASNSSDQSTWVNGPIVLTVDENTGWYSSGGTAGQTPIDTDQLLSVANMQSGLGLIIEVENGYASSVLLAS